MQLQWSLGSRARADESAPVLRPSLTVGFGAGNAARPISLSTSARRVVALVAGRRPERSGGS